MKAKWALAGLGFIAPRHIQAIERTGGELIVTCDTDKEKKPTFTSFSQMTDNVIWNQVTHLAICTPNYLHVAMAARVPGKVVLCEKPLGITTESVEYLSGKVFTVLQLRHHPEVQRLKEAVGDRHNVSLVVRAKRDQSYWDGWKGNESQSGGILFNLGIHYFDLLVHLFGVPTASSCVSTKKRATGTVEFGNIECMFDIEILSDTNGQERSLVIDGEKILLSDKDNLSYEDLHVKVYEDILQEKGVTVNEAIKSIRLVEKLKGGRAF